MDDDLGSLHRTPQESADELEQKLLFMAYELEAANIQANEEIIGNNNEHATTQLLSLIHMAYQERDEARDQLQELMEGTLTIPSSSSPPPPAAPNPPPIDHHQFFLLGRSNVSLFPPLSPPENPVFYPSKAIANSSITESNSLSETQNYSYSSTVNSFIDSVSSPDLSSIKAIPDSSTLAFPPMQDYPGTFISTDTVMASQPFSHQPSKNDHLNGTLADQIDQDDMLIYTLVKGRELPRKGRLLKAVMEAGPLLQTLMVAGPMPRWRNPPPPLQTSQIPAVGIRGFDGGLVVGQKQGFNGCLLGKRLIMGSRNDQVMVENFVVGGVSSGLCLNGGATQAAGSHGSMPKRRRTMQ